MRLDIVIIAVFTTLVPVGAAAQEVRVPTTVGAGETVQVTEVKPEVYYLRNKAGELVYVPNFSFEKWAQLVRQARNLSNPPLPVYILEEMTITGEADPAAARFKVTFRVQQRASEETRDDPSASAWVRVPLRLGRAILVGTPDFEGPGEHFVTFDAQHDGYVFWMQAKPATRHTATLEFRVPTQAVGDQRQLELMLPTPLVSTLSFKVPLPRAEGTIESDDDNATRALTFTTKSDRDGEFSARGLRGNVVLRWRAARATSSVSKIQLDVFGSIVVTADEPLSEVQSDGRFIVRTFGTPIDRFRMRLPPGMHFRESPEPGYSVRVVSPPDKTAPVQEVEVQLDRPSTGEIHIRLIAELPPDQNGASPSLTVKRVIDRDVKLEPAKFEFLGATRHRGNVDFVVKGDWELHWTTDPNLPRVEAASTPPPTPSEAARFTYFRQPCDLAVTIRRKATRISVEPTYDARLDEQQVRLTAVLVCRTSGVQTPPLAIHMRGWTIETMQFDEGESTSPIDVTETNPLVVPIPTGIQTLGRFTVRIEARRELTAGVISGTQPLRVEFPTIASTNPTRANLIVSPATVTMLPAENIAITPRPKETQGLAPLAAPSEASDQDLDASVLRYRDQGGSEAASFVCDFRVRPRSITITIDSMATLSADSLTVEQHGTYTIQNEPLLTLALNVPKTLLDNQRLNARIFWNDQLISPTVSAAAGADRVLCTAMLPEPCLGTADLHIQIPHQSISTAKPSQLTVPLIFPASGELGTSVIDNRLTIAYDRPLQIKLVGGPWAKDENESHAGTMCLTTAADGADVQLQVTPQSIQRADATIIQQTWIQTWIAGADRRDRAVFRIRTTQSRIQATLPANGKHAATLNSAAIDGRQAVPVTHRGAESIELVLSNAPATAAREHVIELWYSITGGRPTGTHWTLHAATLEGMDRTHTCYWQLVLPSTDIMMTGDRHGVLERRWRWNWFGWYREPWQEQSDLEDLLGASHQDPVPSNTNLYLFVTLGAPRTLGTVTVARSLVVLAVSGLVLTIGLLLIYVPRLRHPASLLIGGVAVLALAARAPDVAIIAAQAAALGIALVPVAFLLNRFVRHGRPEGKPSRSAIIRDSKLMEAQFSHGEGSSRVRKIGSSQSTTLPQTGPES